MKQLLSASRALILLLTFIVSACSTDTPSTTPVGGQLATRTFREHHRNGDTTYQKTFAIFYNNANPKISLRATSTTLASTVLPYDVTLPTEQYHLDSLLPLSTSYTWHVIGASNGIPTFDLTVLAADSIGFSNVYSGDTATIGSTLSVQWVPIVPGGKVTVELDQGTSALSTQTITDAGSASVDLSGAKQGMVSLYVFRSNDASATVLGKLYDMTSEYYALDTLFVHP